MDDSEQIAGMIGQRLREERRVKGMTLEALGEATGLSSAFLSRLERGESSTSIGNLIRVARAIGVPLQRVFEDDVANASPGYAISRRKERAAQALLSGPGYAYRHFHGLTSEQRLEIFELEYPAGGTQQFPLLAHEGEEEVLYLLSGRLQYQVGSDMFVMEQGDCVHLQSRQPHRGWNTGERPARLLMIVAPALGAARAKSARASVSTHPLLASAAAALPAQQTAGSTFRRTVGKELRARKAR